MDISRSSILNVMKIPNFERHHEFNVCVKLLLSFFHGGYLWLERCITVNPVLIHRITRLGMKGTNPQYFYLGKTTDHTLAQEIKDTYGNLEKGK